MYTQSLCAAALAFTSFTCLALGNDFVGVRGTGQVSLIEQPTDVRKRADLDGPEIYVFRERNGRLDAPIEVDILGSNLPKLGTSALGNYLINNLEDIDTAWGTVPARTPFSSFFVHIDSQSDAAFNGFVGDLHFTNQILGIVLVHDRPGNGNGRLERLGDTDKLVGSPGTIYPSRSNNSDDWELRNRDGSSPGSSGEVDTVRVETDLRQLTISASNLERLDQMRILVANGRVISTPVFENIFLAPEITAVQDTLEINPFSPPAVISHAEIEAAFASAVQGTPQTIKKTTTSFITGVLRETVKSIDTGDAVPGLDFEADDLNDLATYYSLTLADVAVDDVTTNYFTDLVTEHTTTFTLTLPFGDYNKDGFVDSADYTVYRDTLGQNVPLPYHGADGDGDGRITDSDYYVWKSNYGRKVGDNASLAITIPEPTSLICLLSSSLMAFRQEWLR